MDMFLLLTCLVRFPKRSLWREVGKDPELSSTLGGNTDKYAEKMGTDSGKWVVG